MRCNSFYPTERRQVSGGCCAAREKSPRFRLFGDGLFFRGMLHYLKIDAENTQMAMTMNGEVQLAAPREVVWTKLNDPEILKACIPGCEELEKVSDTEFRATARMKVGPVSARFKGRVTLSDLDPPNGYRISGEGEGGVAGFAKGGATVALAEKDGGTALTYDVEAQIGGKLAQLGQRLVNGSAKKLADEFFSNFAEAVQGKQP